MLRTALRDDIPAMHRIRMSVRENRLTTSVITEADYLPQIEQHGRGWVIEAQAEIADFAIGNAANGSIWALFVDPAHERGGYGKQLLEATVSWLWSQGLEQLWLTTEPDTRAHHFYQAAGWQHTGFTASGEIRFELYKPNPGGQPSTEVP